MLAGFLLAQRTLFTPFSGVERMLVAFEVVIIGGLGSFWGALAGLAGAGTAALLAPALDLSTLEDVEAFQAIGFWIAAAIGTGAPLAVGALMRSRLGLALLTVRDNELAARSIGVDVWRVRFIAFVISGFGRGVWGRVAGR